MNKKNTFSFGKTFFDSLRYLKETRNFIWFVVLVFFTLFFIGLFVPVPSEIRISLLEMIKQIIEQTKNMSTFELTKFIFWNNLKVSFLGFVSGVFFCFIPVFFALSNGYLLGFVADESVRVEGILSLWKIFPHGIFELPAVFISLGIGIKLGSFIFQTNKIQSLLDFFKKGIKVFVFIVIPLLAIAAIIEGILIALIS